MNYEKHKDDIIKKKAPQVFENICYNFFERG
jgi:hypothetical protein